MPRKTADLRKNYGFRLVASGKDYIVGQGLGPHKQTPGFMGNKGKTATQSDRAAKDPALTTRPPSSRSPITGYMSTHLFKILDSALYRRYSQIIAVSDKVGEAFLRWLPGLGEESYES